MALYATLKFNKSFTNIAFTGILTEKKTFETVEHLEEKLKIAHSMGFPLVYPEREVLANTRNLEEFLNDLKVPLSILLAEDRVKEFEANFRFKENYLKKVFNLQSPLHYKVKNGILEENKSSFEKIENWLSTVTQEIKEKIFSKIKEAKVATAHSLIAPAFICGLKLSKAGLPVIFYGYDRSKRDYKSVYAISDDKFIKPIKPSEYFEIHKPKEVEEIYILTKSSFQPAEKILLLKAKNSKLPEDERIKGIAQGIASYLRTLPKDKNYKFKMEIPTTLAFALGYYLEDYLNLSIYHKNLVAFRIGKKGNVYLTNTFSISMLPVRELQINLKPLSVEEAKEILRAGNFISYISHQSTAQVLSELMGVKVNFNRANLHLNTGDTLIVFQIYKRPHTGQTFSPEEIKDILEKEEFTFWKVEIIS
jgi:hypothetical protein